MMIMVMTITREQRKAAKRHLIAQIDQGASVQQAMATIAIPIHRATVYHLLKRVHTEGETAFSDGRHGHPIKLRGEIRTFLIELCQVSPHTPSPHVQTALQERFGLIISVSQINRMRATLGLSNRSIQREKSSEPLPSTEVEWQESAGSLVLLAAATETGLLAQLSQALPKA
jgi:transposase